MKSTKQKKAILAAVLAMKNHPTADEVYNKLREDYPHLSMGTVYRNLNIFAKKGDIGKIAVPSSGDRFDYRTDKHEHLLCESCGKVFDVDVEVDIRLNEREVMVQGYTLFLHGLCPKCNLEKDKH